jgi:hypothetical protein
MASNTVPVRVAYGDGKITHQRSVNLLDRIQRAGIDFIKIENFYTFDGQKGFVGPQGE